MYYFASETNDTHSSQIYFNQSGHAPNSATVHLLYQRRRSSDTGRGTIRIYIDYGASIIPVQVNVFKLTGAFY